MLNKTNKGVSLILSYVILIGIGLALSVAVYTWMRDSSNISPPVDCNEGTSMIVDRYECSAGIIPGGAAAGIDLYLKNNGRFNIDGFVLVVGNDSNKAPEYFLLPDSPISSRVGKGNYFFPVPFQPGETTLAEFSNKNESGDVEEIKNITIIQIQPFVIEKTGKIFCKNSLITQRIEDCQINV